jgi:hypothetical protein
VINLDLSDILRPMLQKLFTVVIREVSLKRKAQYGSPPDTNLYGSAPSYIKNTNYLVAKPDTLIRRSTVLSLSPQVVFPAVINSLSWYSQLLACHVEPT